MLVGGRGERRTLRIVADYAQEWNVVGADLQEYQRLAEVLANHCADVGRDPATIRHSQMSAPIIGRDEKELHAHFARIVEKIPALGERPIEEMLPAMAERGWLVGSPAQIVDELGHREEAGITRTMLQHHASDDFGTLELIASEVLPQVQRS